MKVLALVTDGFGSSGGIAQYNENLFTALVAASAVRQVAVVPRYGAGGQSLPAGIEQMRAAPGDLRWSLNAIVKATAGFDVLFCGHLYAAPLALVLARARRKPLWLQVHGIEAWRPPSRAVRYAVEHAQLVTAVSRYTRQRLLSWSDIDPALVRVLPNTVAPSWNLCAQRAAAQPGASRDRPSDLRSRLGLAGKRIILTVSRLSASETYKGHDRIIAALPRIVQRHDVGYLIVGDGDDVPRLKALAAAGGVADRVHFTGRVPAGELASYFAVADVFAMPSTGEGFGIAFIEAAACGLPVIAGNGDGSADALADGRIGRLIDPHDPQALAEALLAALEGRLGADPAEVRRFAFANFAARVDDLVAALA